MFERLLILGLLLVTEAWAVSDRFRTDAVLAIVSPEGVPLVEIAVEIAATSEARARGLMFRRLPREDTGMLFVYTGAAPRRFWMRNTPESLDMLFADDRRRIFHIAPDTEPLSDTVYPSRGPARYVLETRAGFAARHRIGPGSTFRILAPDSPEPSGSEP